MNFPFRWIHGLPLPIQPQGVIVAVASNKQVVVSTKVSWASDRDSSCRRIVHKETWQKQDAEENTSKIQGVEDFLPSPVLHLEAVLCLEQEKWSMPHLKVLSQRWTLKIPIWKKKILHKIHFPIQREKRTFAFAVRGQFNDIFGHIKRKLTKIESLLCHACE